MTTSASCRNVTTQSRRKAILDAALLCFLSKGFTDTTMEDIRQASGASTGSIYHHFENKEKIAIELYREGRNDLNTALFTGLLTSDSREDLKRAGHNNLNAVLSRGLLTSDPREGLKALVYNYLNWFEQSPDLGLYIIQAASTEYLGRHVEEVRQSTDSFQQHFFEWLAPFIESGEIIRYPQHLYIPLAVGPSREFIRIWLRKRLPEQLHEAREPLARAALQVLCTHA